MAEKKNLTLVDIARKAGVSSATVSRVLNGFDGISLDISERVMAAVEELGYQPKSTRSKSKKSPWVAVLTAGFTDMFFHNVLEGIQDQAQEEGLIASVIAMTNKRSRQGEVMKQLKHHSLAGIIAAGFYQPAENWITFSEEIKVPIVLVNALVEHPSIASIIVNFENAALQGTQHLLNLGHTHIAFVGDYDYTEFSEAQLRGVKLALARSGLTYPAEYETWVAHTPEGASQGISKLMRLPAYKRPTAIFAFDDELAVNILNAIRLFGLRVPEDISVMGFDNIFISAHTNPPLTTIDIPQRRIGRQSVLLLKKLMNNSQNWLGYTFIDGSLIVRNSTGIAPRDLNSSERLQNILNPVS